MNPSAASRRPARLQATGFRPTRGALIAASLCLAAMATGVWAVPETDLAQASLEPLPKPDLSTMDAAARSKMEKARHNLEMASQAGNIPGPAMAEGHAFVGQLYHAFGLLDAAATCYRNARTLAPGDPRWPHLLGLAEISRGNLVVAERAFARTLELDSGNLPAMLRLGNVLIDLGRPEDARNHFSRVYASEPDNAAARYGLGRAAALLGDERGAVDHLERALELQPDAGVVSYALGQIYARMGNSERASSLIAQRNEQEVRIADPLALQVTRLAKGTASEVVLAQARRGEDFSEDQFLGYVLAQLGGVGGAADQLRALVESSEEEALVQGRMRYAIGGLLVAEGRDAEAMAELQRAVSLAPELVDAYVKIGNIQARAGQLEAAAASYGLALERNPEHPGALAKRAQALADLGKAGDALQAMEQAARNQPQDAAAQRRLALALEEAGRQQEARDFHRKALALELSPEDRLDSLYRLAGLERVAGDAAASEAQYREALKQDGSYAPALSGLGSLLAQTGRLQESAEVYGRLVREEPQLLAPRLAEATALILSGQHGAARDRLESGLQAFPEELQLKDILARHLAACPDLEVRDGNRALQLAQEVYDQVPTLESTETLAMAFAEAGRFAEAAEWQRKLLANLPENADPRGVERLRKNLARYEAGERCCAS